MGVSSVPGNSSDIRVSGIWIQGRTQAKYQQKLCCDRKKKNQRSGRLKMVWVITRRSRMVKSRAGLHGPHDAAGWSGFPDQFQIGAAESIRSAYTPLKPRTDGQPCHLSETTIYMQLTLLSGGWWWLQIKRSNDWRSYLRARLLVGRFFFSNLWPHPPGPLTTQAMGPSPCCSLSPSRHLGPGLLCIHTYQNIVTILHCQNLQKS